MDVLQFNETLSIVVSFSLIMENFWSSNSDFSIENCFCFLGVILRLLSGAL